MEDHLRYLSSYRAVETRQVTDWIKAGQCGSVVGLRGAGKSNFIRFLLRTDMRQFYLDEHQGHFIFILVNLLSLTERSEWGVYELIVNNILQQLRPPDVDEEVILEVRTLHQEIMLVRDTLHAERAVERCVALLCQHSDRRLVLLFDEFDAVFRDLPASLFRCLRAIRDSHKDQISYLVVVVHGLASLRTDLTEEVDHFYRLVSRNSCWLGPYCEADALQMTSYLASRRGLELGEKDAASLLELSGGHAGMLKTLLNLLSTKDSAGRVMEPASVLAKKSDIQRENQKVWEGLSEDEKFALCALVNRGHVDEKAFNHLVARGLVRRKRNASTIFSPLFALFVRAQTPPQQTNTYIDRSSRFVQFEGRRVENLTELELELFSYLYEHCGRVCTKNDLIENVYHYQSGLGVDLSDEMLQTLVSRLRKKIELDSKHPCYILTVRGEGYKLVLPPEK